MFTHWAWGPGIVQKLDPKIGMLCLNGGGTPILGIGAPCILGLLPNCNKLPINGGGVLGLNAGGNIGGPVNVGGAVKGP